MQQSPGPQQEPVSFFALPFAPPVPLTGITERRRLAKKRRRLSPPTASGGGGGGDTAGERWQFAAPHLSLAHPTQTQRVLEENELDRKTQHLLQNIYSEVGGRDGLLRFMAEFGATSTELGARGMSLRALDHFLVHYISHPSRQRDFSYAGGPHLYHLYTAQVNALGKSRFDTFARGTRFWLRSSTPASGLEPAVMTLGKANMMLFCYRYKVFDTLRRHYADVVADMDQYNRHGVRTRGRRARPCVVATPSAAASTTEHLVL